ncbi:MAG: hypothetical protein RIT45_1424 [Pseudomonadota bacterium]|jgi:acetyl esterase
MPTAPPTFAERLSTTFWGPLLMDRAADGARALRYLPKLRPEAHGVQVEVGRAYGPRREHRYDIYRPTDATGPLPFAIYIHGGGFQFFDRRSHWAMATEIARRGYVVANLDYRLAPRHRYPAAVQDVALAYAHLADVAASLGAVPGQCLLAGESAGANLALGLAIASCWQRPEAHTRQVWEAPMRPACLLPACGYLQVDSPERHAAHRPLGSVVEARVHAVSRQYLPDHTPPLPEHAFASPLRIVEAAAHTKALPERPFPPTHALVGEVDPVVTDTLRLGAALQQLGVAVEAPVYPGRGHTFHALPFRDDARRAWQAQMDFAARHLPPGT